VTQLFFAGNQELFEQVSDSAADPLQMGVWQHQELLKHAPLNVQLQGWLAVPTLWLFLFDCFFVGEVEEVKQLALELDDVLGEGEAVVIDKFDEFSFQGDDEASLM
jgi:hypothetical protein